MATAVEDAPEAETVSNVRQDISEIDGNAGNLTGLDVRIDDVYDFRWVEGSDELLTGLGDDGAVLPDNVAEDNDLAVGDTLTVRSTDNETKDFVVRGIYDGSPFYPLLGSASVSQAAFDGLYDRPRNRFTLINVPGDPESGEGRHRAHASRTSRIRASRPGRTGSTRRTARSSSSCCCSTSCSRCP